jgi:hypothetical protein
LILASSVVFSSINFFFTKGRRPIPQRRNSRPRESLSDAHHYDLDPDIGAEPVSNRI